MLEKTAAQPVVQCTRRLQFCAGHRVMNHEGKCAHLHGHNYVVLFSARAKELDSIGRVIDFGQLKERLGQWIDEHWDHGFILYERDREAIKAVEHVPGQKMYLMNSNPTAENIAQHLLSLVAPQQLAGTDVEVFRIVVWETENCYAEAAHESVPDLMRNSRKHRSSSRPAVAASAESTRTNYS